MIRACISSQQVFQIVYHLLPLYFTLLLAFNFELWVPWLSWRQQPNQRDIFLCRFVTSMSITNWGGYMNWDNFESSNRYLERRIEVTLSDRKHVNAQCEMAKSHSCCDTSLDRLKFTPREKGRALQVILTKYVDNNLCLKHGPPSPEKSICTPQRLSTGQQCRKKPKRIAMSRFVTF